MSTSIVSLVATHQVTETIAGQPSASASSKALVHDQWNKTVSMNSGSTPAVTKSACFQKALVAGSGSIDLTALTNAEGTVDGTGLKVRSVFFENPSTNANSITLAAGSYLLFGASWSLVLAPGQWIMAYLDSDAPTIASDVKTIDLTGTGTQALNCMITMG